MIRCLYPISETLRLYVHTYMYHIIRTARLGANSLSRIALLGRHARVARSGKSTTYRIMEESPSPPSPPNARQESISRAFAILMMLSFTSLACCSIAIPDSIDLARAIGEPFDESSIPVSIFRLGTCCGGVAVFLIERHWQLNQLGSPDSMPLSLGRFRLLLLLVLACELSGAVGYTIVTSSIRAKDDSAGSSLLWAVLLLSRWTMGVGDGINFSSIYLFIMGAHAAAERGPKLAHWQTVNIFAIGLGPILSSCATVLPSYARFANVGWVQLTLLSASLAVFILCYPSLDDVPSIEASDTDAATAAPGLGAASRWLVVLGGLLIPGLLNFAVGGLEVGSASLLEVQLAFSAKALGLMIGLAFIACTLVRGAYLTLQHGLSNDGWCARTPCWPSSRPRSSSGDGVARHGSITARHRGSAATVPPAPPSWLPALAVPEEPASSEATSTLEAGCCCSSYAVTTCSTHAQR